MENGEKGGRVASRAAFLEQLWCRSTCCRAVQWGRGCDAPHLRRRGVSDIFSAVAEQRRLRPSSPPRCRRDRGKVSTPAPVLGLLSSTQSPYVAGHGLTWSTWSDLANQSVSAKKRCAVSELVRGRWGAQVTTSVGALTPNPRPLDTRGDPIPARIVCPHACAVDVSSRRPQSCRGTKAARAVRGG